MPARNEALDSSSQRLPSLTADREADAYLPPHLAYRKPAGQGKLWLVCLLLIAVGGATAWWGDQKMQLLEAELVALKEHQGRTTQGREDFAEQLSMLQRRLSAIEAQPMPDLQPLGTRLQHVEQRLSQLDQVPPVQPSAPAPDASVLIQPLQAQQAELQQGMDRLQGHLDAVNEVLAKLQVGMTGILERQSHLETEQAKWLAQLEQQGREAKADLESAKKQWVTPRIPDHSDTLKHLEQEISGLHAELARLPKPSAASSKPSVTVQEFDLFRSQTTRHITTLQGQVANLQDQIDRK